MMKLYMSSYRLGNKIDYLKDWIKNNDNKIAVIPNALDHHLDINVRMQKIDEKIPDLEELGFDFKIFDLRDYFNNPKKLLEDLKEYNAVYVLGGNTFVLRRAMNLSGFDVFIDSKKKEKNFLYSGYSAGICVLADYMHGVEIEDDKDFDPYNSGFTMFEGLGVIDYVPVPHYKTVYGDADLVDKTVEYMKENNFKYKTIKDGEVIIEEI